MDRNNIAERGLRRDQHSIDRCDHHRSTDVPDRGVRGLLKKG